MGLFTYYFLKSIHNLNADVDRNKRITANEIQNYLRDKVTRKAAILHNVEQIPTLEGKNKAREIFR
jgi:hypothetical protein